MSKPTTPQPKFRVYEGEDGAWRWRLQDANGETVAQGEGYVGRASAERGVHNVAQTASQAIVVFEHEKETADGG